MRNDPNRVLRVSADATVNARDYTMVLADATSAAIALILITPGIYGEWSIKVANIGTGSDVSLSVAGGGSFSFTLPAGAACEVTQDDLGVLRVFASTSGSSGGGAIPAGSSITYSATPYAGTGSFQPIGPDLNLDAAAGSSTDSKYIAVGMFNVIGDALTKTKTYIAAVIAKLSITGTNLSTYPRAAIAAEIGDGVTEASAAFCAVLGGDSALTTATAAFGVDLQNSTPGSGFAFGVDLSRATHDGYPANSFTDSDLRFSNGLTLTMVSTAITANVTLTSKTAGNMAVTSNATGRGSFFFSDGTKWQNVA